MSFRFIDALAVALSSEFFTASSMWDGLRDVGLDRGVGDREQCCSSGDVGDDVVGLPNCDEEVVDEQDIV